MMNQARNISRMLLAPTLCLLLLPAMAFASDKPEPVGHMLASPAVVQWQPGVENEKIVLKVIAPDGTAYTKEFPSGSAPSLRLQDLGSGRSVDGAYSYELLVIPRISDEVKKQLAAARAADDDAAVERITKSAGIGEAVRQSGTLTVANGSFVNSDAAEPGRSIVRLPKATATAATARKITPNDDVIADDLIVQGSACVGLDCVNNESFGFDTIRLKENNTRIKFDDTSTGTGFPNHNWQLTANDSASGGAEKFSIEDITAATVPFTVTGSSPSNSIFVASTGKVGFRTATPALDIHVTTSDTPAIRQEQTNAGGFTAQTWDIGANEANWFVRDVTGGSRLPLRIRPGAPTSSVDISASGNVGIGGVTSPAFKVEVGTTFAGETSTVVTNTDAGTASFAGIGARNGIASTDIFRLLAMGTGWTTSGPFVQDSGVIQAAATLSGGISIATTNAAGVIRFYTGGSTERARFDSSGNLGLGVTAPTNPIQHSSGALLTPGGVWTNASSRALKQDIVDLPAGDAMTALKELNPVTYSYKVDPNEHHVGFIAEDVPSLVATKDRKGVSPMDVVAVLTKVVQEQQSTIDELKARLAKLENQQQSQ